MKIRLIGLSLLLMTVFSSCSLFQTTPDAVIKGQRAVYQSVLVGEAAAMRLVDIYEKDCKKLVAYHANFVFQLKLVAIDESEEPEEPDRWNPSRETQRREAEEKRDEQIKKAYDKIDKRVEVMRANIKKHYGISQRLVGSVYNYLSTSPIEVDNMEFWINKLDQIANEADNENKEN